MKCPTCSFKDALVRTIIIRKIEGSVLAFDAIRCRFCVFRDVYADKYKEAHDDYIGFDITDMETKVIADTFADRKKILKKGEELGIGG